MICKHCGASIDNPQAKFCPRCGGKQDVADSHPAPKDAVQSVNPQSKVAAPQQPQKPQQGQQTWQPWNPQQAQQPQQAQKPQQAQQVQQPQQAQKPQQPQQGQQAWQPWNPQQPQQSQKPQQPQNSLHAADQKKKKKTWIVILIVAVALVLLVSAVLLVTFLIPWSRGVGQNTMQDYQVEEYEDEPEERPDEDEAWAEDSMEQIASETASVVFDMPACVGMDRRSAMEYFDDADCTLVMEYEYSNDYEEGLVIRQSVEEGTQLQPGQEVTLVISMGAMPCPYEYSQKVTVSAPYGSSYATLVLYEWADGDWQEQFRCSATVGKNGISSNYGEGKGYSPEGVFKLGVALSANSIANDTWPFWQVDSNTCVVDDTDSYLYNTIQNKNDLASGISYDSIGRKLTNGTNNVLIYIEHNGNGINSDGVVSGKGSVITLCGCSASIKPTAGCVDISTSDMNTLLSLLDHSQNPHIELVTQ